MKPNEISWISNFKRQIGYKKSIILYGNINDSIYPADSMEVSKTLNYLVTLLKSSGFNSVIVWDRFEGIDYSFIGTDEINSQEETPSSKNISNDFLDEDPQENTTKGPALKDPGEFFPFAKNIILSKNSERKTAIILDWSSHLFGNSNSLSEEERQWILILGKTIRNQEFSIISDNLKENNNILIVLTQNLGLIPPIFYTGHPGISNILISKPTRGERKLFLENNWNRFRFSPSDKNPSMIQDNFIDSTDSFYLSDLIELMKLSRQTAEAFTPEQLINVYRYGEKISPWEELSRKKLESIEMSLKKRVKGQDNAITKVKDVILRAYTGLAGLQHSAKAKKPKGALFFVGPTGVGKTELAKSIAEFLFGDESSCLRFDMSEYNHEHSDQKLIGAPPGYVGYEEGGQLTNAVRENPFSVLLFDEIEKAHGRILDKFLQILEDGRLTDSKGQTVSFSESIIIFTSNIGASEVQSNDPDIKKAFIEKVNDHFINVLKRPELLNRIGNNIVPFDFITSDEFLISIASNKLIPLVNHLKDKYKVDLLIDNENEILLPIIKKVNRSNGGRGVLNELETKIIDPLSGFIFENENYLSPGTKIKISRISSTSMFEFEIVK
ncbi:MAG: AAA family ATPase [Leptospiraceae bacterium]|nr:AAA family ATPase [Leptospiraceae bacterium]